MAVEDINIETLAANPEYDLSVARSEREDERAARLAREGADASSERRMRESLFYVALIVVLGTLAMCLYIMVLKANAAVDERQWARSVFSALVASLLAFMTAQKFGKSASK